MEVVQEIEFKLFQAFLNTLKKKGAVETLKILETKTREVNIEDEYLRSIDGLNPRFKADIPYIKVKDRLDKKIKELKK